MRCFLLSMIAVTGVLCDGPVYVRELTGLLPRGSPDRYELKMLDNNKYMIRSEKQNRLDEILARQSADIQLQYNAKVQYKEAQRALKQQYSQQLADQQGYGDFAKQMTAITNDMSISSAEAYLKGEQVKQQYYQLNQQQQQQQEYYEYPSNPDIIDDSY